MKRRLPILLLLALLGVGAVVVCKYWNGLFPLGDTSEVYRQYRHLPGVRAAFIRQMPINDTLRLDMTLLEAEDSAAFADLLKKLAYTDESINDIMTTEGDENSRYTRSYRKNHPEMPKDKEDKSNNDVMGLFYKRYAVAFFHTRCEEDVNILLYANMFKTVNINK
jgi:hypothetical protein